MICNNIVIDMAPTEQDVHNKFRQEKNYALEKSASTKNMLLHRFVKKINQNCKADNHEPLFSQTKS